MHNHAHFPHRPGAAEITVTVRNDGEQPREVIVDYQVYFRKAHGQLRTSTFKLGKGAGPAGGTVVLRKRHTFKDVTIRTLYPGVHALVAQVNGNPGPRIEFTLEES